MKNMIKKLILSIKRFFLSELFLSVSSVTESGILSIGYGSLFGVVGLEGAGGVVGVEGAGGVGVDGVVGADGAIGDGEDGDVGAGGGVGLTTHKLPCFTYPSLHLSNSQVRDVVEFVTLYRAFGSAFVGGVHLASLFPIQVPQVLVIFTFAPWSRLALNLPTSIEQS